MLLCTLKDQVRISLKNLINAAKEPYKMVKDMVSKILPVIKRNIERIKENLLEMKRNIVNVGKQSSHPQIIQN